jgi:hypothetical protein
MPNLLPKPPEHTIQVEASPEELERERQLREEEEALMRSHAEATAATYHDRPAAFVLNCIKWEKGQKPTRYQLANLQRLVKHHRVAVRGPHGLGKTTQNAWVVLWFALTRDAAGEDWKIITTASAWRQLTHYLWPEIRKWSKQLDWKALGREPFTKDEFLRLNLRLNHGEAFAVACEDPATIEGAHADQMLYIYDEAKTIPAETFDASEGAFSGAGEDTDNEAFALASSTPGEPAGRFYEIHAHKPGLQDWTAVHVTLDDAQKAHRVSKEWARERALQWGKTSAVYINRVEGNFAASEEDGVIALSWVEAANERWRKLHDAGFPELGPLSTLGADIARKGGDRTVLARRYGHVLRDLIRLPRQDTMPTAGAIKVELHKDEGHRKAVVDVQNVGAGVVDRLREQGEDVLAFNAQEKSNMVDRSGELGFINCRAAAWWNLRELLMPDSGYEVALPPDELLTGDLTAPKHKMSSGGRIQIESKEDIKKRIGRSTDDGDAVVMAFYTMKMPAASPPIFSRKASRWAPTGQRILGG